MTRLITRRGFLAGSAGLAAAGALGIAGCGGGSARPSGSPDAWIPVSIAGLEPGVPRWVEFRTPTGADGDASPAGGSAAPPTPGGTPADAIPTGSDGAWLIRSADDSVVAFVPYCPHQLCLYDWQSADAVFRCRCHPGVFDREGAVQAGPPPRPLWRYETRPGDDPETILLGWFRTS